MKLLVISDTHLPSRSGPDVVNFIQSKEFDLLIHCGDYATIDATTKIQQCARNKFLWVIWNCDDALTCSLLPEKLSTDLAGYPVHIFHSFDISPRGDRKQLLKVAKSTNSKLVFFWHTHIQQILQYKNWEFIEHQKLWNIDDQSIYFINPWSLADGNYLELEI